MKVSSMYPPPMLSLRPVKAFSSLVLAALFGTVLFAASVAVSSEPASANLVVNFNCDKNIYVTPGASVVFNAKTRGCFTGSTGNCRHDFSASATARIQSVSAHATACRFNIAVKATFTAGHSETFRINSDPISGGVRGVGNPFASARWITVTVATRPASGITFTAPTDLAVGINRTKTIDALDYVTETHASYTITCADATSYDSTKLTSVTRIPSGNGCGFTITPSQQGSASFQVPYNSAGGTSVTGTIPIRVGTASTIVFSAPASNPVVPVDSSRVIDVSGYASDGSYAISCDTITESSALISISALDGCSLTVAAGSSTGTAMITVPYISSGGDTHTAMITITVTLSNIVFTPPSIFVVLAGSGVVINAAPYATDGDFTVRCENIASKSNLIAAVSRDGCLYTVVAGRDAGPAEFEIIYTSSGGDTHRASIYGTILPSSISPSSDPEPQPEYTPATDTTPSGADPVDAAERSSEIEETSPWNTLTVQPGGTTARAIRQTLGLSSRQTIYYWNTDTQTWTPVTNPASTIHSGITLSFQTPAEISQEDLEIANLDQGARQTVLTQGWNIINPPETTTRTTDSSFLFDPDLTDCESLQGIIAVASYNTQTRQWALWLPCHPQTQTTLTTGDNPPYRPLTQINPQDTTYIYTRTRQSTAIVWNAETQTYQTAS